MIFILTDHAMRRMQQRKISKTAIELTIKYGKEIIKNLTYKYVLTKKSLKQIYDFNKINLERYEGLNVIVSNENSIITSYTRCN